MALYLDNQVSDSIRAWWDSGDRMLATLRAQMCAAWGGGVGRRVGTKITGNVLTVDLEEETVLGLVWICRSLTWSPAAGNLSECIDNPGGSSRSSDALLLNWGLTRAWLSIGLTS